MNVVLMHDWLTGFRGGERLLEVFCEMFPDAPLYTLIHKKGSTSKIIEDREIKTSFLNMIPGVHENYRKFLPLMPIAAEWMKVEGQVDLILSSSHCVIKGVQKPTSAKHLCYIHSPMRYIYDQFDAYFENAPMVQKMAAHLVRPYLQGWDFASNNDVDLFVANSHFVQERVKNYYQRESLVIHPFVELDDFTIGTEKIVKEDFYLMVTAFAPNKRVDLAVETFNQLGLPLKIVGSGQMERELKANANKNIEFLGNLDRAEIIDLYYRAKAFIFPGVEDFGITPLEALAAGTPVIAYSGGGVLETLNDKFAQFFYQPTIESLKEAIQIFERRKFNISDLRTRAKNFSKDKFKSEIKKTIDDLLNGRLNSLK